MRLLADMFSRVENELGEGPWFSDNRFSLVDAVYGPIFRYFDVFDQIGEFGILQAKPKTAAWRRALSNRASIENAVTPDYPARLLTFLKNRASALSVLRSRLYALAQQRQREKMAELQGEKKDIAWGNQIRSYTLAPYQLVKDHRTGVEMGNIDAVFDGALDAFIQGYLMAHRAVAP